MEIETLFGLPAHPLVVHAAVVLLPLAALGVVLVAAIPSTRRHYAPVVFAVALAATAAVGLAQGSGESLEHQVDKTALVREHTGRAERVLPWSIGVTVVAGLLVVAEPARKRTQKVSPNVLTGGLLVLALVAGVGASWTIIDVGHSGAKATWNDVQAERE